MDEICYLRCAFVLQYWFSHTDIAHYWRCLSFPRTTSSGPYEALNKQVKKYAAIQVMSLLSKENYLLWAC